MAESSDSQSTIPSEEEQAEARRSLDELKKDLEGWREAFVPIRLLLTWQKPYYPAIIFCITTFVFAVIWILEPSVLTTFAVLGLVVIGTDFILPFVSPYIFSSVQWTGVEEVQFEEACETILSLRTNVSSFVRTMGALKQERPRIYFALVMGILVTFAWIGTMMNNLFLSYFIALAVLMFPGLQQTRVVQQYFMKYWVMVKRMILGHIDITKVKKN